MIVVVVISLEGCGSPAWELDDFLKECICFLLTKKHLFTMDSLQTIEKYKKKNGNPS